MPQMFAYGIRKGQSAEDIAVGQARTRVFQQSDFYRANFLNNPKAGRAFDPENIGDRVGGPLTRRKTAEIGPIPDATLRAMDVAGNVVGAKQGKTSTTDSRLATPIATESVSQSKRQRTAGAQLIKSRKRLPGKVRRPKASTIPITEESQLG